MDFTSFTPLKFGSFWIYPPKVLEFGSVKSKHLQTFEGKIQILKFYGVKSKYPQTLEGKIQILKFYGVKSKHPQTLGV